MYEVRFECVLGWPEGCIKEGPINHVSYKKWDTQPEIKMYNSIVMYCLPRGLTSRPSAIGKGDLYRRCEACLHQEHSTMMDDD